MSAYNVRLYKDSDFPAVKRIFIAGCQEHTTAAFHGALMVPRNWLLLLVVFVLPLVTIGSILLSILDVVIVLVLFWLSGREFFHSYARHALVEDLKDIKSYYLQREGYGFWVVESAGEGVVGMVAAVPSYLPGGEKHIELRRMSVAGTHRGKGVAKLLCKTLVDFARKTGYDAVILSTTTVQVGALKLYEKMGFSCVHTMESPKLTDRLARITWVIYKYDIKKSK